MQQQLAAQCLLVPGRLWLPLALSGLLTVVSATSFIRQTRLQAEFGRLRAEAQELRRGGWEVLQLLTDAETGGRGYLIAQETTFLEPYFDAKKRLPGAMERLAATLRIAPGSHGLTERLTTSIHERMRIIDQTVQMIQSGERAAALRLVASGTGKTKHDEVRRLIADELATVSQTLDQEWGRLQAASVQANWLAAVAGAVGLLLLSAVTWALTWTTVRTQELLKWQASRHEQYLRLARYQQQNGEQERAAMARKVHDEIGQTITAAKLEIAGAARKLAAGDPELRGRLSSAMDLLDDTIRVARDLSSELRPPLLEAAGLLAASEFELKRFAERTGLASRWQAPNAEPDLPAEAKLALFRVMQEALTNVARHAHAAIVGVELKLGSGGLELVVTDSGTGMLTTSAPEGSLGILGMRERMAAWGGSLEMESRAGAGTRVKAWLPLAAARANSFSKDTEL